MRLAYGSLINCLIDNKPNKIVPVCGDAATIVSYTDRYPGTVIGSHFTKGGKLVVMVQEDKAVRLDKNGMSEEQEYKYERDEKGRVFTFTERKDGVLRERCGSYTLALGFREKYYDFSF